MLENLTDRLQSVIKTIRGQARFTEENISSRMTKLTKELSDLFEKSRNLEDEIRKNLGGIGYEI